MRSYLDGLHERSALLPHVPCRFAREVASVLDQLGVVTWSSTAGPLELHLVQKKSPGEPTEAAGAPKSYSGGCGAEVYECSEAEAYFALRQGERNAQLTMATKLRHKLLQRCSEST